MTFFQNKFLLSFQKKFDIFWKFSWALLRWWFSDTCILPINNCLGFPNPPQVRESNTLMIERYFKSRVSKSVFFIHTFEHRRIVYRGHKMYLKLTHLIYFLGTVNLYLATEGNDGQVIFLVISFSEANCNNRKNTNINQQRNLLNKNWKYDPQERFKRW